MAPVIPRSHFARVRTWVEYGLTASQVAQVYGVSVGEVERILRKA
jgi:DNA-directed RNA polymerase specialized sigma24 family protein